MHIPGVFEALETNTFLDAATASPRIRHAANQYSQFARAVHNFSAQGSREIRN
jgi:hypothetical protein